MDGFLLIDKAGGVTSHDVVAAAEIDPLHLRDEFAELRFEGRDRAFEDVGALLVWPSK